MYVTIPTAMIPSDVRSKTLPLASSTEEHCQDWVLPILAQGDAITVSGGAFNEGEDCPNLTSLAATIQSLVYSAAVPPASTAASLGNIPSESMPATGGVAVSEAGAPGAFDRESTADLGPEPSLWLEAPLSPPVTPLKGCDRGSLDVGPPDPHSSEHDEGPPDPHSSSSEKEEDCDDDSEGTRDGGDFICSERTSGSTCTWAYRAGPGNAESVFMSPSKAEESHCSDFHSDGGEDRDGAPFSAVENENHTMSSSCPAPTSAASPAEASLSTVAAAPPNWPVSVPFTAEDAALFERLNLMLNEEFSPIAQDLPSPLPAEPSTASMTPNTPSLLSAAAPPFAPSRTTTAIPITVSDYLLAHMATHWSQLRNLRSLEIRSCPTGLCQQYPHLFRALPSLTELKLVGPDSRLKEAYGPSQPSFKVCWSIQFIRLMFSWQSVCAIYVREYILIR